MGKESALSQQCHCQLLCRVPLGTSSFPFGSTSVLPCATSLGCAGTSGTGAPSCLPPLTHLTQHFHPARVPGVLQHRIQHSLTTETSSLTPLPPAFAVSKEGIPDSCQHHRSAVTSQGAQRMYPRSGIRNSVCREGQDDTISCTIPYTSKLIRALLEEPFNVPTEQPSGKARRHSWALVIASNFLLFMGHGLVVPTLSQTFPRAERGKAPPSMLLKPERICSSILLHYLPLHRDTAPSSSAHCLGLQYRMCPAVWIPSPAVTPAGQ